MYVCVCILMSAVYPGLKLTHIHTYVDMCIKYDKMCPSIHMFGLLLLQYVRKVKGQRASHQLYTRYRGA